jgi:hypothetical protein
VIWQHELEEPFSAEQWEQAVRRFSAALSASRPSGTDQPPPTRQAPSERPATGRAAPARDGGEGS